MRTLHSMLALLLLVLAVSPATGSAASLAQTAPAVEVSEAGSWQCWDPGSPLPCGGYLNDVDAASDRLAWAVGNDGMLLRWNGDSWAEMLSPVTYPLNTVDVLSETAAWAGGYGGILSWDGLAWTVAAATNWNVRALSMLSPSDGWAAGDQGHFLHWDGSTWASVASPTTSSIYGLDMITPSDGWAAGEDTLWPPGTIYPAVLHWDGTAWTKTTLSTEFGALWALDMLSSTDGWAVGDLGLIMRWDGQGWTRANSPTNLRLYAIAMRTPDDGWAVGGWSGWSGEFSVALHWDGNAWTEANIPQIGEVTGLTLMPGGQGWAVTLRGLLLHLNGNTWSVLDWPTGPYQLRDLELLSPDSGWAIGWWTEAGMPGSIYYWDGEAWSETLRLDGYEPSAIDMLSPTDGWIVGTPSLVLRWRGTSWAQVPVAVTEGNLADIAMLSATDGWIVGSQGDPGSPGSAVALHWDGSTWSPTAVPTFIEWGLDAVDVVSPTDAWAAGNGAQGTILHWDGASWAPVTSPVTETMISAIDMLAADNGWMAGSGGALLHWDGSRWTQVPSPTTEWIFDLHMITATDGWATGWNGPLLHWDGIAWQKVDSPADRHECCSAVQVLPDGTGWAVGSIVLRYDERLWVNNTADLPDAAIGDGICATAPGNGSCTLRAAIQETNARPGPDHIILPTGTHALSIPGRGEDQAATGDLDINGDLVLEGAGVDATVVDGSGLDRVLQVASAVWVELHSLTLRGGSVSPNSGGGVLTESTLELHGVRLAENSAGAGGGLAVLGSGHATINDATFERNQAAQGGALYVDGDGTLNLAQSTVMSNIATTGAGLYLSGRQAEVTNATISGNTAQGHGGGIAAISGTLTLSSATLADNEAAGDGGGLFQVTTVISAQNTLLAANSDAGGEAPECAGVLTSLGYNLIENIAGCTVTGDLSGVITGTSALLGALAHNGGPTLTQALLAASPAIDAGNPTGCRDAVGALLIRDQRGFPRPWGMRCDLGAYEYVVPGPYQALIPLVAQQAGTR